MKNLQYRRDIDGLRAIAVLSVVAFHFHPDVFPGGFIGVDIFFVISGFLIANVIQSNLKSNGFNFIDFYAARIRRIFPSLALVLAATLILGLFTMLPDDYRDLGRLVFAGATFSQNFVLWMQSGYFDGASDFKPLLHLWSLGVEEQFYLVFPLILWLIHRFKINVFLSISLIAAISFILGLIVGGRDISAAFFLPHTRIWELLAGALLAFGNHFNAKPKSVWLSFVLNFNKPLVVNAINISGLFLLGAAFFLISKGRAFPGWWAVLPVLATTLIIYAGEGAWISRAILQSRVFVGIGLISYPLYLWHWVLLSFVKIRCGGCDYDPVQNLILFLTSLLLAWITYRFIEKPIRFGSFLVIKTWLLIVIVSILGFIGFKVGGASPSGVYSAYQDRMANMSAPYLKTLDRSHRESECFDRPYAQVADEWYCVLGDQHNVTNYFAYGDSHALSLLPALELYANNNGKRIDFSATSGCPPFLGIQSLGGDKWLSEHNCNKINERIFTYVESKKINAVILIGRWTYYVGSKSRPGEINFISFESFDKATMESSQMAFIQGLKNTISRFNAVGTHVYLVEDNPQQIYSIKQVIRKVKNVSDSHLNDYSVTAKEHLENQAYVNNLLRLNQGKGASFISTTDILCNKVKCPLVKGGNSLYYDDDHLSVAGAKELTPLLNYHLRH